MALPDQRINTGLFQPTTAEFDVQRLQSANVNSTEFKELLVRLAQTVNSTLRDINRREAALYFLEEFVTGQLWNNAQASNTNVTDPSVFSPLNQSQGFRKVLFLTSDPHTSPAETPVLGAGTTNVAHGLSPQVSTSTGGGSPFTSYPGWQFTHLYGVASNTTSRVYYPLNFSDSNYLSAYVTNTNVVINNQTGVTFDKVRIVLEYVKF